MKLALSLVTTFALYATATTSFHAQKTRMMTGNYWMTAPFCFATKASAEQEVAGSEGNFTVADVTSDGRAKGYIKFDMALTNAMIEIDIMDLEGKFLMAHLHCGAAGANGPVVVNLTPFYKDGKIYGTITNAEIAGGCAINVAQLKSAMTNGQIYLNVHTDEFKAGELRGQWHWYSCDH
mmetsp:Transcript_18106/g.34466  ORF Transcript_18106/g.34466 Transcript_18106/m.34466 type:complete len:179 (-) Transcript_18106:179-715(-)|eukprot:CAMPEP_0167787390 /NCGR_PEP_ID=MMETSP0111_2-20121227/9391_1 /TAXON_ID=91324 /ORGANISM="Lotharella globosa, Strain CCCM811" /LENGTH=178 /DNA_ID=CAMNT_0007679017 /DNA_START=40 /DNA_END=576 /DNA_ORIENTATION=-